MFRRFGDWLTGLLFKDGKTNWPAVLSVFLAIISPVIILAAFSYRGTYQDLTSFALSRRQTIAYLVAATLKEKFDRLKDISVSLATRVRFRQLVSEGKWDEAIQILQDVPKNFPFIDRLFLADLDGTLRADSPALFGVRVKNFAYRDWYKGVSIHGKPYISEVYKTAAEPRLNVIAAAALIKNEDQKVVGFLVLEVRLDILLEWASRIEVGPSGFLFLVDSKGRAATHPKFAANREIMDFSAVPTVQKVLRGERGVEIAFNPIENEERLVAYEPVPEYGWGVIAQEPTDTAFAARDNQLVRIFFAYSLICLFSVVLAYLIVRAFTKRKRADAALHQSEARFRALSETANDAIISANSQGRIVFFNPSAERIFGYRASEVIDQPLTMLMPERFHDAHRSGLARYLSTGEARVVGRTAELTGRRKDGAEFPMELSLASWQTGDATFFTGIIRDITERKRFQEKLQETNRLKSEFLANMSHELRTPLNGIIGFSELIHDGKAGPISATQKEYIGDILTSSNHLLQLINDVLDLAKVEAGKMEFQPEPIELRNLVRETCDIVRTMAAKKRLKIETSVDREVNSVVVDPAKLKQVLYNYLSNAIKFTPDGGQIAVRIGPDGPNSFRLAVEDTGIGIKQEDIARLFVEFQQLDASAAKQYSGTGLGLALTKRIVEAMGGSVGVHSIPGKRTAFFAVMPSTIEVGCTSGPRKTAIRDRAAHGTGIGK